MQLMTWTMARFGSRFGLVFEPYHRRVLHSALGRYLDRPLELLVGFIEPDGVRRVLPFAPEVEGITDLVNCEQFERLNSITFRGFSARYLLRFEFNVHSVFYPQNERLCVMPAFYLEMRVNPVERVRWMAPIGPTPDAVSVFLHVRRPQTQITAYTEGEGRIDLSYTGGLYPHADVSQAASEDLGVAHVAEQIVSLNPDCQMTDLGDGAGLEYTLPVTEAGSGIKWRLVWAAHTADPVLQVGRADTVANATFRYNTHWSNVTEVAREAIQTRDDHLAHSRRLEKLLEQAPVRGAELHLVNQSFQSFLSNTFWCDLQLPEGAESQWFSVWDGSCHFHSPLDVEYNNSLFYLAIWPRLLRMQIRQWSGHENAHAPSGGSYLSHDMGWGPLVSGQKFPHAMEVEENSNYLLMLQAYAHWTGDTAIVSELTGLVERLVCYLIWCDRDQSGFASEGVANTVCDAGPEIQFSKHQTYLAVKRVAALRAASSLMRIVQKSQAASEYEARAERDLRRIESAAWLGDHYAVCVDRNSVGIVDVWTGKPLPYEDLAGWDGYSIYTANGSLLPTLIGQPPLLDPERVKQDIFNSYRENFVRYGCGHTSSEAENILISQNLWRDLVAYYLGMPVNMSQTYWDMQVMSNTGSQSYGYVDSYMNNDLRFYSRGIASLGYYLAGPRLVINRLAPGTGGAYITVSPDREYPQRWPLLALADWKAGKIPVCVVDDHGNATIEGEIDPVIIHGGNPAEGATGGGLIG